MALPQMQKLAKRRHFYLVALIVPRSRPIIVAN